MRAQGDMQDLIARDVIMAILVTLYKQEITANLATAMEMETYMPQIGVITGPESACNVQAILTDGIANNAKKVSLEIHCRVNAKHVIATNMGPYQVNVIL